MKYELLSEEQREKQNKKQKLFKRYKFCKITKKNTTENNNKIQKKGKITIWKNIQ